MLAVYIFCAVLGVPLVVLLALGGGDVDAGADIDFDGGFDIDADVDMDVGGADLDVGSDGFGDFTAMFRRIPVSSYAFFLAFFGLGGLLGTLFSVNFVATIVLAVIAGMAGFSVNTALFSFLRNSQNDSMLTDKQIEGRIATVSVPIAVGKRGRVWLDTGDERLQLTAGSVEDAIDQSFDLGEEVIIVKVDNGVAQVMSIDPDLVE